MDQCLFYSARLINTFDFEGQFASRTVGTQGGFQAASCCVAIAFGIVGGGCVGKLFTADPTAASLSHEPESSFRVVTLYFYNN